MTRRPKSLKFLVGLLVLVQLWMPLVAAALPRGGQVAGGQATIQQASPQKLHIQQGSDRAILNWQQFSIASGETVQYFQPSVNSVALNRVIGADASVILGQLLANGRIFLINPNGILFGAGAVVNVGGLLATTLRIQDSDFMAGRYTFAQDPTSALKTVINKGEIHVSDHGFVVLVAPGVANEGLIVANLGTAVLGSGERLVLDLMGDGLINYAISGKVLEQVKGPDGTPLSSAVRNAGIIQADGGKVIMEAKASNDIFASVVNQSGVIRARSLINHGGTVKLLGGDEALTVATEAGAMRPAGEVSGVVSNTGTIDVSAAEAGAAAGSVLLVGERVGQFGVIDARGADNARGGDVVVTSTERTLLSDNSLTDVSGVANSSAGTVRVWSDRDTFFTAGSTILARGGETGGNGGFVEVSGKENLSYAGFVDALAPYGTVGTLLLDPMNIIVQTAGGVPYNPGVNNLFANTPAATVRITPASINAQAANVVLQANNDITIANAIAMVTPGVGITMQAGRDILVNASVSTNNGFISMTANDSAAIAANRTAGTTGDIVFAAGANLSAGTGNITLAIGPSAVAPFSPGSITTVRNLTTTTGNITINSRNTVSLSGAVNAGSGTVTINANTDGAGAQSFTMNAGSSMTTTNATAAAVTINVNAALGGAGTAALRNITTGSGGTLTVATNTGGNATGGDITQTAGTLLNVGAGTVALSTSTAAGMNIGTAGARVLTTAGTVTASTGGSGVFITESNGANFTATATGGAAINLLSTTGTLTIAGATSTGSGAVTLASGDAVAINAALNAGSGTVTINTNTNAAGADSFSMGAAGSITTTNATAAAVAINVNAAGGGTGGATLGSVTTGAGGRLSVTTNVGGNATGGPITQIAAITATNLRLSSVSAITLNDPANAITTLAATVTGAGNTLSFTEADGFSVGALGGLNGVSTTNGALTLTTVTGPLTVTNTGAAADVNAGTSTVTLAASGANQLLTIRPAGANVTGTGGVTYTADRMTLTGTTTATSAVATVQPFSAGRSVDLGGADSATTLGLTAAELNTVTAGTLRVGSLTSGDLNVSAAIAPAGTTTLSLMSGGTVTQTATITETNLAISSVGPVTLNSANSITTLAANVTGVGNALSFTEANGFSVGAVDGVNGVGTTNGAITLTATTGGLTVTNTAAAADVNAGTGAVTLNANGADQTLTTTGGADVTGNGGVTLVADNMTLNGTVTATGQIVSVRQFTNGRLIDLGSNVAGQLAFTDPELDGITAANIRIGNNNSGNISNTASISPGGSSTLTLQTAGTVTQTAAGSLTVPTLVVTTLNNAGSAITLNNASNDVTATTLRARNAADTANAPGAISYQDANGFDAAGAQTTSTLNLTAGGTMTGSGALIVGGTTTVAAGASNDISLNNGGNNFSTVAVTSGNNVTLRDTDALNLGASTVSGSLTVTAGGLISQSGAVAVAGPASFDTTAAATLGSVSLTNGGALTLATSTVGGNLALTTTAGDITLPGGQTLTVVGDATLTPAGTVNLLGTTRIGGAQTFIGGTGSTFVLAADTNLNALALPAAGKITVQLTGTTATFAGPPLLPAAVTLPNAGNSLGGTVSVTTVAPAFTGTVTNTYNLTQSAAVGLNPGQGLTVTDLGGTAGTRGNITLPTAGNSFNTVTFTGGDIAWQEANAVTIGSVSANAGATSSGALTITAAGLITQTGAIAAAGTTTLAAGAGNDITLATATNNFSTVAITSGNNVTLVDTDALILGASTVSGTLNVTTTGALTQSGAVSVAGTTTLAAGATNDITLTTPGNDFSTVGITSANNATVVDSNALDLGNATVSSSLNVTAGGSITQTAGILNAGPGTITLNGTGIGTAVAPVQTTAGTIAAGAGPGGVFINESDGANFTATATGAGAINVASTTGTLTIAGATSTGSGPVSLTADSMAIAAPVSSTGALTLQPVTPGQSIGIAGGAGGLSLSGASLANLTDGFSSITIGRSNGTGAMTVNAVTFNDPVTLQSPAGGTIAVNGQITGAGNASVTLDGAATTLGAGIVTAGNPITIIDPVTLSAPVALDATNAGGSPAGANLTVAGTMNGAQALTLEAGTGGTIALNGAIGGITPVAGLTVTNAGDVTFAGNVITTGNLMQTAGTGTTTLNGATIGGNLSFTTNAITLATAPVSVTGGNITLAAASRVTQNANLTAAGAGTINATTTVGAITMAPTASTTSGTGSVNYTAGTDVILGALSTGGAVNVTAQGGSILSAGGAATHVTAGANSTLRALGGIVGTGAMPITVNVNPGTLGVAATMEIGGFSGVLTGTVVPSNTLALLNVPPGCVSFNGVCVTTSTNIPLSLLTRGTLVYLNPDVIVPTYYQDPSRSVTIPRLTSVYVPTSLLAPSDVTISGGGVRQGTTTSLVPEQLTTEPESLPLSSLPEPSDVTNPGGSAQEETIASSVLEQPTTQGESQPLSTPQIDMTRLSSSVAQSVSQIQFKSGQGDLGPTGRELLKQVSEILKSVANMRIQIEGHTDNVPIGPKLLPLYPSNWELAKARAANAVRILVEEGGIDPALISSVARADTRPVASNATAEGRNKNRRIEIVLTPKDRPEAALSPPADQPGR